MFLLLCPFSETNVFFSDRVLFTHELDSHDSFEAVDCGTFTTLPNGDDLEKGSMPRPDLPGHPESKYEEVWRGLKFPEGPDGRTKGISWILESESSPSRLPGEGSQDKEAVQITKTFLARIWGVYVALRQQQEYTRHREPNGEWLITDRSGGEVSARREEWVRSPLAAASSPSARSLGWRERYILGPDAGDLPSLIAGIDGEAQGFWRERGATVVVGGESYIVRAFEAIQ